MTKIGIDPEKGIGLVSNGTLLFCETLRNMEHLKSVLRKLVEAVHIDLCVVELPSNRKVYPRKGQNDYAMRKISVNVGENRQKADEIIRFCKELGLNVTTKPPVVGARYMTDNAETFNRATGWKGRTSRHARVAAILVW